MRFHLFMLLTAGVPEELVLGMAGPRTGWSQRSLSEIGRIAVIGLHAALRFDEVFLWVNRGLSPIGDVLRGLELFAERVMPRFA